MSDAAVNLPPEMPTDTPNVDSEGQSSESSNVEGKSDKQPPAEPKKRYKVKVDDTEDEVDEDELVRGYQRARASNMKFEEAAKIRKQAEKFIETLRTDPRKILANPKLGLDFKKLAEEYLAEQYEQELLSPEEIEQRKKDRELEEYRSKEQSAQKKQEQEREEQLKEFLRGDYEKKIIGALEKVQIPKTDACIKRMISYAKKNIQNGYDLPMEDIAELVREDYLSDVKQMFSSLEGDQLLQMLGNDIADKIRKSDLQKLKSSRKTSGQTQAPTPRHSKSNDEPKKVLNSADFLRSMREQRG